MRNERRKQKEKMLYYAAIITDSRSIDLRDAAGHLRLVSYFKQYLQLPSFP